MKVTGLHMLLTYQCTFECDHCFVWGSPWQSGSMTLPDIRLYLQQAQETGTVTWIYFEGGEPFLYYANLLKGVQMASQMGFKVGLVSNAYWATDPEDALEWLRPFKGLLQDISVSSDLFHYSEKISQQSNNASQAAAELGIPLGVISIAGPDGTGAQAGSGQLPPGESGVMYRGRAAEKLAHLAPQVPWDTLNTCSDEDLREPGRVHLDPLGNVHICQGIILGNLFQQRLVDICRAYDPVAHPITGPLLAGGPRALVQQYHQTHKPTYADACQLCFETRQALRGLFPHILGPDQMYAVHEG